ncbi:MAG TPA: hypothetical protein PK878_10070, partial [bacterium]|nr:hypothetical protein [bacterium]
MGSSMPDSWGAKRKKATDVPAMESIHDQVNINKSGMKTGGEVEISSWWTSRGRINCREDG